MHAASMSSAVSTPGASYAGAFPPVSPARPNRAFPFL